MNIDNKKQRFSLPFTELELRLYLDTHPNDVRALEAYRQVCEALYSSGSTYSGVCARGDSQNRESGWTWIDNPWPWEAEANIIEGEE